MTTKASLIADAKQRMHTSLETVRRELAGMRTGRASLSMLDGIRVDYYGNPTPLNQVASLSTPDPTLITVQPWDPKVLPVIEKAIRTSDLDLNPQNDGKIIRIPVPSLTEERRKTLVKHAHKHAEEGRVAVRNVRRDVNDHLKRMLKDHEVSEDDEKQAMAEVRTGGLGPVPARPPRIIRPCPSRSSTAPAASAITRRDSC
jgi:ribosome recycling factor